MTLTLIDADPPYGLADNETVCPSCRLVCTTTAMQHGVCRDCAAEGVQTLF